MKALVKPKPIEGQDWPKGLKLTDKPEPQITSPEEVKLKVIAAAICGTDVSIYNSSEALRKSMSNLETDEVITGHEFCGELTDAGDEAKKQLVKLLYQREFANDQVKDFLAKHKPDELISSPELIPFIKENFYLSAEMHIVCWQCRQCQLGEGHACQNTYIKGLHKDGIFAEYVVVPASNLILFAKGEIPPEVIAFMDAIGNATHTVQSVEVKDANILVLGAGIQGLMSVAVAKKMGARKVFLTDASRPELNADKLEKTKFSLARNLGADWCFDVATKEGQDALAEKISQETNNTGVDAVLEMSGSYNAYPDAFRNIRMGGTLALLGLPSGTIPVDFSTDIIFKGLTVKGVIGRRIFDTWDLMTKLLTEGLSEVIVKNNIVTHQLPLEKFDEGFAAIRAGEGIKVIFKP